MSLYSKVKTYDILTKELLEWVATGRLQIHAQPEERERINELLKQFENVMKDWG